MKSQLQSCYDAEKNQLPCFLPYECREKEQLEGLLGLSQSGDSTLENFARQKQQEQRHLRLHDLSRVELFHHFNSTFKCKMPLTTRPATIARPPPAEQKLKPINLEEMDPAWDRVYEGRIVKLKVISRGHFNGSSVFCLVEDDKGECIRMYVYGDSTLALEVGELLTVANPFHRIGANDKKRCLRIDHPEVIMREGRIHKPCNACCASESKFSCRKCGVFYCTKECQTLDWKKYGHNLVCRLDAEKR